MKNQYHKTIYACFLGYIVQAIVNNFVPLLFLTFEETYQIPLSRITLLVTINFAVQLLVDLLAIGFVDRIGYRVSILIAHIFSAGGVLLLTVLPDRCSEPFVGLLIAVIIYATGGGLLEVLVSPIIESCPTDNKEAAMSLLHSFYCWGHVGVVFLSTVFFAVFGIDNWKIMAIIWACIPLANTILFAKVPIAPLIGEGEKGLTIKELCSKKLFWLFLLMMICAGASEQWASTFAEKGLGVSKTIGDLAGPMFFAICMGLSRAYYGKFGEKINLQRFMIGSSMLCVVSYLGIVFFTIPALGLISCGIAGLSVGIMWPGTFSMASASIKRGGTAMFALMALAGDLGCAGGPTVVMVSGHFADNLQMGTLAAIVFPVILCVGLAYTKKVRNV